jgi:hypothetical protein
MRPSARSATRSAPPVHSEQTSWNRLGRGLGALTCGELRRPGFRGSPFCWATIFWFACRAECLNFRPSRVNGGTNFPNRKLLSQWPLWRFVPLRMPHPPLSEKGRRGEGERGRQRGGDTGNGVRSLVSRVKGQSDAVDCNCLCHFAKLGRRLAK